MVRRVFDRFAIRVAEATGTSLAFVLALTVLCVWALTGPIFGFSDTWQLIVNTGTTIVTFLMVFLIQHSENKNSRALHLKIDELIAASKRASNQLIDLEESTDEEMEGVHRRLTKLVGEQIGSTSKT